MLPLSVHSRVIFGYTLILGNDKQQDFPGTKCRITLLFPYKEGKEKKKEKLSTRATGREVDPGLLLRCMTGRDQGGPCPKRSAGTS